MQWIALGRAFAAAAIIALTQTGCSSPAPQRRKPLPPPPVVTRAPQPLPPPIARPKPAPRPTPAPPATPPAAVDSGVLDTSGLRPSGGIRKGMWKVIVVHHSEKANATPQGMHAYHIQRGWENGLGYHFVIGNGVNYPDGKIFAGPRWKKQTAGAHCKASAGTYFGVRRASNFFNDSGIGICLIGNFESGRPTARQQAALKQLIAHLCRETGISPKRVYGHGEVTHKTACPGRNFSVAALRSTLAAAESGAPPFAALDATEPGFELEFALVGSDAEYASAADCYAHQALLGSYALAKCVDLFNGVLLDALDHIADAHIGTPGGAVCCDIDHDHPPGGGIGAHADAVAAGHVR